MALPSRVGPDETARRVAQFTAAARERGLKLTPQRLEIFREVASSLEHPDAVAVYTAVRARLPTVSLDTVYRTLWTLGGLGLVSTLGASRESVRFDANPRKHHHYVCVRCGLTRDFESDELHALRLPAAVRALGKVMSTHIEARGLCGPCSRKSKTHDATSRTRPNGRRGHHHG